jgi:hypothetical protein
MFPSEVACAYTNDRITLPRLVVEYRHRMLFAQVHFFGAILMQVVLKQTNNLRALLERIVELLVPCPY